jgi:hypothetical protein
LELLIGFEVILEGHADEFIEGFDLALLGEDDGLLLGGFALGFELANGAEAKLNLVVDVIGDEGHFLDDLLFIIELGEGALEFLVELVEILEGFVAFDLGGGLPGGITVVHLLIEDPDFLDQFAEGAEMVVAALDLFIEDNAVEPFLGGFGDQFFGEGDMFFAGEAEAINDAFDLVFGVLDAFGDLDFLFAGEERDLPHLLKVHPDRVIEDIEAGFVFLLLGFGLADAIDLGLVNDFDVESAEFAVDFVQFVGGDEGIGQGVVDVGVSQVALFLGQPDEFLDLLGDIDARLALDGAEVGGGGERRLSGLGWAGSRGMRVAWRARGAGLSWLGVGLIGSLRGSGGGEGWLFSSFLPPQIGSVRWLGLSGVVSGTRLASGFSDGLCSFFRMRLGRASSDFRFNHRVESGVGHFLQKRSQNIGSGPGFVKPGKA